MEQLYGKEYRTLARTINMNDSIKGGQVYQLIDGEVVNNIINRKNNYFTINRGSLQGVRDNMAVITPEGIAGIVINTTQNYALVQSILSVDKIKINASLKKSNYFGTLSWNGEDTR